MTPARWVLMKIRARVVKDVASYWPLYLVAIAGALIMGFGATRIDQPRWAYAWIAAIGVAWAAVGLLLKRRVERRLATGAEHTQH